MKSVLFVCSANRCRSTMLEAVLAHMAKEKGVEVHVESCGIGYVSEGAPADPRSVAEAAKIGVEIRSRAQSFHESFFDRFDYIFAVSERVFEELKARAGKKVRSKIYIASAFSEMGRGESIGDPYAAVNGFEVMRDQVVKCCEGILKELQCE